MSDALAWRDATLDDLPEIEALARRCDQAYGTLELTVVDSLRHELLRTGGSAVSCVALAAGRVTAAGWVRRVAAGAQQRDLLYALADPEPPDLHAEVLRSLIDRCPPSTPGDVRRTERVLAPATPGLPRPITELYASLGFALKFIEHEMACDAHAIRGTPASHVGDIAIAPWSQGAHAGVRTAYNHAFRDRGFAGYEPDEWRLSFPTEEVAATASFIALRGDEVVGFTLAADPRSQSQWVDPATRDGGWIDTVGVVPAHRGRGLATALVAASLHAFGDAGVKRAALRVNDDNDRARRVYERLGFEAVRKHVVYERRG